MYPAIVSIRCKRSVRFKAPLVFPYHVFSANINFHFLALNEVKTATGLKKYSTILYYIRLSTCDRPSPLSSSDPELILTMDTPCNLLSFLSSHSELEDKKKSPTPIGRKRQTSAKSSILGVKQLQGLRACVYLHCTSSAFSERRNRKRHC